MVTVRLGSQQLPWDPPHRDPEVGGAPNLQKLPYLHATQDVRIGCPASGHLAGSARFVGVS